MQEIKEKVVVITGASSESIRERAVGKGGATAVMLVEQVSPTRRVTATASSMFS